VARPPRIEVAGGVYHVIARGNERRAIFRDDSDRRIYLSRLATCRERFGFALYAYCLMGNHVHLALERGKVPLSRIMLGLQSFYSQRFNRRHDRVGHLFQGRYAAFLVEKERYLFALLRYIHLNPVKAGLVNQAKDYAWCSDRYYRSGSGPEWLDLDRVLRMMGRKRSEAVARYRRLVDGSSVPLYEEIEAVARAIKGEEEFAERLLSKVGEAPPPGRVWRVETVAEAVASAERCSIGKLRRPGKSAYLSLIRSIAAYVGRLEGRIPLAQMARYFERDESTLVKGVQKLEAALEVDDRLRTRVSSIAARLRADNARLQG
jgi:putative transposase